MKAVYDLSATPFYLKGSGYPEGTLFPWVVSDFSLMDAIECGIVKIPRVPVADNAMTGDYPKYRNLWVDIRDGLPKDVRRGPEDAHTPPLLPGLLEGALKSLYGHYARKFARVGGRRGVAGQRQHPARVHRRLQQHQRQQGGLRLHRRVRDRTRRTPTASRSSPPATLPLFSNVEGPALAAPAEHDPRGQPAARIRRGHVRRLQEARRRTRSRTSRPSTAGGSPAATPRT